MKTQLPAELIKARAHSFRAILGQSACALTSAATLVAAASAQQVTVAPPAGVLGKGAETLYGPVVATAVEIPGEKPEVITRGIVVRGADEKHSWCFCYDVDHARVAAVWHDGFLDLKRTNLGTYKGLTNGAAIPLGSLMKRALVADSGYRSDESVQYLGYYVHGSAIVFSYRVGDCPVLERPYFDRVEGRDVLFREFVLGPSKAALSLHFGALIGDTNEFGIADGPGITKSLSPFPIAASELRSKTQTGFSIFGMFFNEKVKPNSAGAYPITAGNDREGGSHFDIDARPESLRCTAYEYFSPGQERPKMAPSPENAKLEVAELSAKGGPSNWPQTITVTGKRARDDAAYVVDTIPLPDENPWKCWLRPTGLDFLPDGRLALCTLGGDVWIASGIDDSLAKVTWRRFAGGLREPMGLRVVDGKILVGCRDQITRLHDLNGDGEADFYECVNMGRTLVANFHAFAYDLQTDPAGNFYYGTGGNQLGPDQPWHGKLWRVSPDGKKLVAYAKGLRAPNGLTISPEGAIYVSDNQGNWIPSSKISRVREGGFYGYVADPKFTDAKVPPTFDPPVCYIPYTWDNSSGGGTFCTSDKWGPYRGRMIHTSFGAAAMFAVFEQRVGDVSNGAIVKFPLAFESGIHRARFGPDGQLYVAGTKGWQSKAIRDGCLARVRYTGATSGKSVTLPTNWRVEKDAIVLEFATPLDRASAEDTQNFAAQQWNYKWHATYGSPDFSVADPKRTGRDTVEIKSVRLSADGKTVTLEVPSLAPVMQILVKANIRFANGPELPIEVAGTINRIP